MVSFELTPTQEELREEVRSLVQEKIVPAALSADRRGDLTFDRSLAELLAQKNLLTPTVPREYGGRGLDYFTTALLLEEISAGCAGLAAVVTANIHAASPLILAGSPEQKQKYLPLLTGPQASLAAFALTEKAAGSDMGALETSVTPYREEGATPGAGSGQRWLLNGSKDYVINGGVARFITLFATTNPSNKRGSLLSLLVPGDAPGLQVGTVRQKMGIRYAHTVQLLFKNVRLNEENIIGRPGSAYLLLMQTFDRGRALAGAIGIGIARAAYEYALQYSKERIQFGRPVFSHQGVSFTLAELATSIEAARLLVWKACWLIDRDLDYSMASSMAKLAASRVAVQVTARAMEICGGSSYLTGHPVEMYLRDARVLPIIEGTDNVQKLVITSLL